MHGSPLRTLLIALAAAVAAILWFRWQAGAPWQPAPGVAPGTAGETPKGPSAGPTRR